MQRAKTGSKFLLGQSDKTKQCSVGQNDCQKLKLILGRAPLYFLYNLL